MNPIGISGVVLTYNEERDIRRCLESLQGVVDEIIVLDSFSSDQTEKICREYTDLFYQAPFAGYVEQKNAALKYASHPYVLSLDADEALTNELKNSILKKKESGLDEQVAYRFNRRNNFCGHWVKRCGWYPDQKVRLWKLSEAKWAGVNPHDKVNIPFEEAQHLSGDLLHYSFYTEEEHFRQIENFSTIKAKAAFASGKRTNWIDMLIAPAFKFFRDYIIKLGILEGKVGWNISKNSAYSKYLLKKKLKQLQSDANK